MTFCKQNLAFSHVLAKAQSHSSDRPNIFKKSVTLPLCHGTPHKYDSNSIIINSLKACTSNAFCMTILVLEMSPQESKFFSV